MQQESTPQLDWLEQSTPKLSPGFPEKMVLLDCETTGLKATVHRIIEVALLVVEQGEIAEQWHTLINPHTHIPPEIQHLTGITPARLVDAPEFADVADILLEKLEGRVLVAHNARFDYGFLKNEFARIEQKYQTKPLCSVKISRQLYPQYKSHRLSAIIRRFNFTIENRHRALDDTLIIWKLFLKISSQFSEENIRSVCGATVKRPALPMHLNAADIDRLPKSPGVYYFYDVQDKLLYIGKSVNIRERVMSHFTQDYRNSKDLEMSALIAHIDFEATPSDFGAQLRESQQIKALNPYYNRRLRKVTKLYQYQMEADEAGYLRIAIRPVEQTFDARLSEQFGLFRSRRQAEGQLEKLAEHFFLCHKLCGLQEGGKSKAGTPCFGYQLKRCFGACCEQEAPEAYNERIHIALKEYRHKAWLWPDAILVEERGKGESDTTWHLLNEWRYITKIHDQDALLERGYQPVNQQVDLAGDKSESADNGSSDTDFDLDIYQILVRFLLDDKLLKQHGIKVIPLMRSE